MGSPAIESLQSIHISEADDYNALTSLDPNKALGIDGIGLKILKNCSESLFQPLCHLFNLSLASSVEWKSYHQIIPIFKSADRSLISNYRPISLLCNVSKVLKHIIFNKIINHITALISPCQFGFLRGRSTTQQLILFLMISTILYPRVTKLMSSTLTSRKHLTVCPIKIFYGLLEYLETFGNGLNHTNRHQYVCINGFIFKPLPVLLGVPQGSVLGPILSLIFVNDLPAAVLNSTLFLFTDDAKVYRPIANATDMALLQEDLNLLNNWSINNHLNFSVHKCIFLSFYTK